jgi:ectoine hydroxylase-related dioxygenase (phytanoyl-CoA dioxygenase family)
MSFFEDGFLVVDDLVSPWDCDELAAHVGRIGEQSAGCRCLLDHDWCSKTAAYLRTRLAAELNSVAELAAVQCTYFHKTPDKNWLVAWHQDRSIPVMSPVASTELTGWSQKEEMTFVHAPDTVLREMTAVRLHLDDSTLDNGPLRIIPGSHRNGTLSREQIEHARKINPETTCVVSKGGVLVMSPLLLHASSKSTTDVPRRVLHFLFAPLQLPHGLRWRHAV